MIRMDSDHCRTVTESINGERPVDERTFASLAVLTERLQQLKNSDPAFDSIAFSPAVRSLLNRKSPIAVGV